ncbi:hypothetical protein [Bradyrhizobium sp. McL0615]
MPVFELLRQMRSRTKPVLSIGDRIAKYGLGVENYGVVREQRLSG